MTLPATRRHTLRQSLAQLQERVKAAAKAGVSLKAQEASRLARQIGESACAGLNEIVVNSLELGSDRSSLQAAIDTIKSMCPKSAIMLFSPDPEAGKATVMAVVPPALVKRGLSAGDWVRHTAEIMGGKGGGKPDAAQGGGANLAKMKEAMKAAEVFAAGKLVG
ncbi:MAG: hypothetical protein H7Y88_00155 [Phycisphaerales bacterium]|nr:hypothetical protein [Phycisphaerales bacterium]